MTAVNDLSQAELISRIQELETQAAFQDELHQQLNEIVARQDREILAIKSHLQEISGRLKDLDNAAPGEQSNPQDEVPPHY